MVCAITYGLHDITWYSETKAHSATFTCNSFCNFKAYHLKKIIPDDWASTWFLIYSEKFGGCDPGDPDRLYSNKNLRSSTHLQSNEQIFETN